MYNHRMSFTRGTKVAILAFLLAGMGLVATAGAWDDHCRSADRAGGGCDVSGQCGREDNERQCDHCLACVVAHGHVQSIIPEPGLFLHISTSIPLCCPSPARISDPRVREIFHPPLDGSR